MTVEKRQYVRLGRPSLDLFDSGACAASTVGKRVDLLAARFQQILATTKLPTPAWAIETWMSYLTLAQQTDLTQIGAIYSIQGNAKALGESRLSYGLESLAPPQQVLLMVLAERFQQQHGEPTQEAVEAFLAAQGYSLPAAAKA